MWLTNCNLLLQHAAPVIKRQQTDKCLITFYDALMNLPLQLHSALVAYVSVIQFFLYSVNFKVIFRMVAKISQSYCGGILIWATMYINCAVKATFHYSSKLQTWLQTWLSTRFAARFSTSSCGFATCFRHAFDFFVENLVANLLRQSRRAVVNRF